MYDSQKPISLAFSFVIIILLMKCPLIDFYFIQFYLLLKSGQMKPSDTNLQSQSLPNHLKNRREISFSQPLNLHHNQYRPIIYPQTNYYSYQTKSKIRQDKSDNILACQHKQINKSSKSLVFSHSQYLEKQQKTVLLQQLQTKRQKSLTFFQLLNGSLVQNNKNNVKSGQQRQKQSQQKIDRISSINLINHKVNHLLKHMSQQTNKNINFSLTNTILTPQNDQLLNPLESQPHNSQSRTALQHIQIQQTKNTLCSTQQAQKNLKKFSHNQKGQLNLRNIEYKQNIYEHRQHKGLFESEDNGRYCKDDNYNPSASLHTFDSRNQRDKDVDANRNLMLSYSQNRNKRYKQEKNRTADKCLAISTKKVIVKGKDIDIQMSKLSSRQKSLNQIKKQLYNQNSAQSQKYTTNRLKGYASSSVCAKHIYEKQINKIANFQYSIALDNSAAESSFKTEALMHQQSNAILKGLAECQQINIVNETLNTNANINTNRTSVLNVSDEDKLISSRHLQKTFTVSQQDIRIPKLLQKLKQKQNRNINKDQNDQKLFNIAQKSQSNFERTVKPQFLNCCLQNDHGRNQTVKGSLQSTDIMKLSAHHEQDISYQAVRQQSLLGFSKLLQNLEQQVKYDARFRQLKKWFNRITDDAKWQTLQVLLKDNFITITQSEMKIIFYTCHQEENPFYTPREDDHNIQDLVLSFKEAEQHWSNQILHKYSLKKLHQAFFLQQNIDIFKRGFLSIEDIVRYVNVQVNKLYRNRDLYLIYLRLKQNRQLYYKDMIESLVK